MCKWGLGWYLSMGSACSSAVCFRLYLRVPPTFTHRGWGQTIANALSFEEPGPAKAKP